MLCPPWIMPSSSPCLTSLPGSRRGPGQADREMLERLGGHEPSVWGWRCWTSPGWVNAKYAEKGGREEGRRGGRLQTQNLSRVSRAWSCRQWLAVLCRVRLKLMIRITEWSGLEGTSVGHPVQPSCRSRVTYSRV